MNVNGNIMNSATSGKLDFPKKTNEKEEFEKVLDNHETCFKNFFNENVNKKYNEYQNLNNAYDNSKLKENTMNFVDVDSDELKQNIEKSSKELEGNDKSTEEVLQVQQILQALNLMIKRAYKVSTTENGKKQLNSINLEQMGEEQLIGIEKLSPETKKILKYNLNEIVALLENTKGNNETSPQILDMLQKVITEVPEVKGELNLLKVPSIKTVSSDSSFVEKFLGNLIGENKEKIKIPKKLVGEDKSTEKVTQIKQILKSMSSMFQNTYETPVNIQHESKLNPINLEQMGEEHLIDVEKLSPISKSMLQNNLTEIVALLENSKGNNEDSPQILDVLQKLTTEVSEVKGDLTLLKVANEKPTVEGNTTTNLNSAYDNNKLKEKIIDFVEVAIDALKQNTYENPTNIHHESKLNPINLEQMGEEHLMDVEKLSPLSKSMLQNNLTEIVDLLENSKGNNEDSPQILDVLQKLTTEVSDVKGDLSLLKVANEKPTVEGNTIKDFNDPYDNNKLKKKIINFVEAAIDALKPNAEKLSKKLVGEDKSNEKVAQVQQVLKSLSSMFGNAYETPTNIQHESKLNPINLEQMDKDHLIDVEKLSPIAKSMLKNNLTEIGTLLENTKGNSEASPQILDVLQKLTTEVSEVNGDLSLLKVVNEKPTVEGSATKDLNSAYDNNKVKEKIIDFVEVAIDALKENTDKSSKELLGEDKSTDKVVQIQQVLKSLSSVFQSVDATKNEVNSINLEQLLGVKKLTPLAETLLKNNLSELVDFNEKSKGNNGNLPKVIDELQKLTTEVVGLKEDSKSLKDNVMTKQSIKNTFGIVPINQLQSSDNTGQGNKFSGNRSFEEKFLNNLIGEDKDETKISKAVNFMNQFEAVKTMDTPKIIAPNNLVINKNNVEVDIIKTIKFMETNNIKDLIVKMNPKELGEITIKITMESGIMKANISAQNKDTYNLLNHNIQDINEGLKNMNIKIQSLDINIYEDSTFFSKNSSEKNNDAKQNNNSKANKDLEEDGDSSIGNNYFIEENQLNKFV